MSANNSPPDPDGSEPVGERVRIYRRGQTWYANYQAGRKQRRVSLKTKNKKLAQKKALRIEAELAAGIWKPASETATVEAAVAAYRQRMLADDLALTTLVQYEAWLNHIVGLAAQRHARDLSAIDLQFVDAYRLKRKQDGAGNNTITGEVFFIRQLLKFCLSRGFIEADPLRALTLKRPKPSLQPCWTAQEVQAILAAAPPTIRPVLALLAETGLRFGELQWLTWADVDLRDGNCVLHVRPKDKWRPKTGNQRTVPLSPVARAVLESLPQLSRWVVTMPPSRIFPERGRQWQERKLLAELKKVLSLLGLPGKIHTFRHFFISNALMKRTAEAMVRKWVGHVDAKILATYTHMHEPASREAMQRLAEENTKLQAPKETENGTEGPSAQT
jgi:integrase